METLATLLLAASIGVADAQAERDKSYQQPEKQYTVEKIVCDNRHQTIKNVGRTDQQVRLDTRKRLARSSRELQRAQ